METQAFLVIVQGHGKPGNAIVIPDIRAAVNAYLMRHLPSSYHPYTVTVAKIVEER